MTTWRAASSITAERPVVWQDLAACKDAIAYGMVKGPDADPFFPGDDKSLAAVGLAFCRSCLVQEECRAEFEEAPIDHGVWAGEHHQPKTAGRPPRPPVVTEALKARYTMYEGGMTDTQIANAEGCERDTIRAWRRWHKLPSNSPARIVSTVATQAQRLTMYENGATDTEIATAQGVPRKTITRWRIRRNLPSNTPVQGNRSQRRRGEDAAMHERRLEMYRAGWSDKRIAEAEGLTLFGARGWRKNRKLPANK